MDNYGFIRQKIDIKVLILYILKRLPAPVNQNMLTELTLIDNATNYFDYIECLTELEEKDLIITTQDKYSITAKGLRTAEEMESSLPYTVRLTAASGAERAAKILAREALIKTAHREKPEGGFTVSLSISDEIGEMMHLDILAGSEKNTATANGDNDSDKDTDPCEDETEDKTDDPNPSLSVEKTTTRNPAKGETYDRSEERSVGKECSI